MDKSMEQRAESCHKFLSLVRSKYSEDENIYNEFLGIMKSFKEQRYFLRRIDTETVCKRVQEIFSFNRQILHEFNRLIPPQYKINVKKKYQYFEAMEYIKRVKEETRHEPEIYENFIKVLKQYQNKETTLEQVTTAIEQILKDFPSLIENFKIFLPSELVSDQEEAYEEEKPTKSRRNSENIDRVIISELNFPLNNNEMNFFYRLKRVLEKNSEEGQDWYLEFVLAFELYADCVITKTELYGLIEPLFVVHDIEKLLESGPSRRGREDPVLSENIKSRMNEMFEMFKKIISSRETNRRKLGWFFKSLADFDTSNCKKNGRSYWEIQRPRIKSEKVSSLINREWVSVPHGSEDVSFKFFRKNIYEDALFKCEDEQFDHHLTIENTLYTLKLMKKAQTEIEEENFELDRNLESMLRQKPLHNVYAAYANRAIEILISDPKRALPVLIPRLEQKVENMKQSHEKEKVWRETMEKNFYKSLDHRSFYFKQSEKRLTNTKAFLAEIKERYSKKDNCRINYRKILEGEKLSFECCGGSESKLFFNSFAGLSASAVKHRVPKYFLDPLIKDFQSIDYVEEGFLREQALLPQFRLLMNKLDVILYSVRILVYAIRKSTYDKEKILVWVKFFFEEVLQLFISQEVFSEKNEEYFENSPFESENFEEIQSETSEVPFYPHSLRYRKDRSFTKYLPLLGDNHVFYCPTGVFSFIRLFYCIYERFVKAKMILSSETDDIHTPINYGEYKETKNIETEYFQFLQSVCMLVSNSLDLSKFEDRCRSLLGNEAYMFFTFDKLMSLTLKTLNQIVQDELSTKSISLFKSFEALKHNEEVYLAEITHLAQTSPLFRFHWNPDFSILSISYIENPLEKLKEQFVNQAESYYKTLHDKSEVPDELEGFSTRKGKCEEKMHWRKQKLLLGIAEKSYKLEFIPGGEDSFFNYEFYSKQILLSLEEKFLCKDKNSFVQKIVERSESRFQDWLNSYY